ncbi:hypothetical protein ERJ75_001379300 [Trypanosoma vivax]|nr:hypothetical protein ERJ75_001379300 [Trypanosoma vivax]
MRTGRSATPRKRWGTTRKQRTQKREALFLQLRRRVHVPREEGGTGMRRFRGQEEEIVLSAWVVGDTSFRFWCQQISGAGDKQGSGETAVLRSQINGMRSTTEVDETDAPGLPERKAGPGTGDREGVCGRREMARGTKCGRGRLNRRKGKRETKDGTGKC